MRLDVKVNPAGPAVMIDLKFGFTCIGAYQATLYDGKNQNGKTFQNGTSTDDVPDVVVVPDPANVLPGRTLLIDASLVPPNPPDQVSITAEARQGANFLGTVTSQAHVGPGQKATPMLFIKFQ
jgi:hypothetical protein